MEQSAIDFLNEAFGVGGLYLFIIIINFFFSIFRLFFALYFSLETKKGWSWTVKNVKQDYVSAIDRFPKKKKKIKKNQKKKNPIPTTSSKLARTSYFPFAYLPKFE